MTWSAPPRPSIGSSTSNARWAWTAARVWPGPACVRLSLASGDEAAARTVALDLAEIAKHALTPSARAAAALARGLVPQLNDDLQKANATVDQFLERRDSSYPHCRRL